MAGAASCDGVLACLHSWAAQSRVQQLIALHAFPVFCFLSFPHAIAAFAGGCWFATSFLCLSDFSLAAILADAVCRAVFTALCDRACPRGRWRFSHACRGGVPRRALRGAAVRHALLPLSSAGHLEQGRAVSSHLRSPVRPWRHRRSRSREATGCRPANAAAVLARQVRQNRRAPQHKQGRARTPDAAPIAMRGAIGSGLENASVVIIAK